MTSDRCWSPLNWRFAASAKRGDRHYPVACSGPVLPRPHQRRRHRCPRHRRGAGARPVRERRGLGPGRPRRDPGADSAVQRWVRHAERHGQAVPPAVVCRDLNAGVHPEPASLLPIGDSLPLLPRQPQTCSGQHRPSTPERTVWLTRSRSMRSSRPRRCRRAASKWSPGVRRTRSADRASVGLSARHLHNSCYPRKAIAEIQNNTGFRPTVTQTAAGERGAVKYRGAHVEES